MLNNEARQNLQSIKEMAIQNWGSSCEFVDLRIIDSPYSEFELQMRLYHEVEVGIYYDRSAIDIGIKQDGKYVLLGKFTTKQVHRGMKVMKSDNLLHNFKVLDEVARERVNSRQR